MDQALQKPSSFEAGSTPDQGVFVFPASFAQQRLWILDQFTPGNPAYNIFDAMKLTGELDVKSLADSLNTILQRHESLRTTFRLQDDRPVQVVAPFSPVSLPVTSLEHLSEPEQAAKTGQLLERTATYSFNLSAGPLFQASLFKLASNEHLLIMNMHHIVSDGWSTTVLWRELSSLYAAYSQGLANPLPDLPIQYPDFSIWQQDWLQGSVLEDHLAYWKQKLAEVPSIEMPVDRLRPAAFTYQGASLSFEIGTSLGTALKELSRKENTTLFMTLLAAFKVLLYRYTGQADVAVGTFSANRNRPEIEGLIGFFVNTLVLRTSLQPQETFRELLQKVRTTSLEAYTHQDLPFEKLVEELNPRRDPSRNPFVQNTFSLQTDSEQELSLAGLKIEQLKVINTSSKFDLFFGIAEKTAGLNLLINYNTNLFNEDRIQRMAGHYITLLESIIADPYQPIASLPMLTAAECRQTLLEWNAAEVDYPPDLCLQHLFERWAYETPQELAVVLKDQKLTYAELESQANKIAHHLVGQGVEPECRVAICMDRSPEMIVGMLGILKAGGAYVPLDPALPQERLAYLLADSRSLLVLANKNYVQPLDGLGTHIICFEEIMAASIYVEKAPQVNIDPDNLAYIMYTSGSTGKPKGVMISHRNVVGFLYGYKPVTRDGPRRVGTSVAPFNFDTSVEEVFSNLCFGGTLHIILPEDSTNADWMGDYLLEQGITTSYIVPDFLPDIASRIRQHGGDLKLKCLITGLAPKKESLLQTFRDLSPDLRILNAYGPTEVTYGATAFEFLEMKDGDHDVPIGIPFPNYRVYVVDANLQPVPVGVVGELLIGGAGVSRGYFDRPGLTARNFIPDPFGAQPGQRLYRSGDLVRYLPDGNIEFIGRADDQVKIRGYRIELGEIEAHLSACPLVRKCVLLVREDQPGDKRLVAYLIPTPGSTPTSTELRNYLAEKLPLFMLPNHFILLDELPLMSNGKVNRSLLPAPDQTRPELDATFEEPATPNEAGLTAIWKELLGIERIGIHDNFFELGGHSLMVIRMIGHIERKMGFKLPLSAIFESPTIHQIGRIMDTEDWQPLWKSLVVIQSAGDKEPLFLVPPAASTGRSFAGLAKYLGSSQPVYSFNCLGLDGRQEPHNRVEDMAALYVSEMLSIQPQGPHLLGGLCFGATVALEMARQLEDQGHKVALVMLFDPSNPNQGLSEVASKKNAGYFIRRIVINIANGTLLKRLARLIRRAYYKKWRIRHKDWGVRKTALRHEEAARNYHIPVYRGRVAFFQSETFLKRNVSLMWKKILNGPVEFIVTSGSTHLTFFKQEENLRTLADRLTALLEQDKPGAEEN